MTRTEAAQEGMELQDLVMAVDARDDVLAHSPPVMEKTQSLTLQLPEVTRNDIAQLDVTGRFDSDAERHSKGLGWEVCCARVFIIAYKHT